MTGTGTNAYMLSHASTEHCAAVMRGLTAAVGRVKASRPRGLIRHWLHEKVRISDLWPRQRPRSPLWTE